MLEVSFTSENRAKYREMGLFNKLAWVALPALAGCGVLSQVSSQGTGANPGGKARERFESIAAILDNPQKIFAKAGYTPVFTASAEEAQSRLPIGLTAMPKQARTWESWFQDSYTINGQKADTASQLVLKYAVVQAAAKDPVLAFNAPLEPKKFISDMLKVESDVLSQHGVSQKDTVARQIARLDIAAGWVFGRRSYGKEAMRKYIPIEQASKQYTNLRTLLGEDISITCGYAVTNMIYITREMEKISPTGLTVGGLFVFKCDIDGKRPLHGMVGAFINLPNGQKAALYYDPTPIANTLNPKLYDLVIRFGPTSQAALEHLANNMSIAALPNDKTLVGPNANHVTYTYKLNENWGPKFALGNFDASAVPSYGDFTGGFQDYEKGAIPFDSYKKNNQEPVSLENTLRQEFQKF